MGNQVSLLRVNTKDTSDSREEESAHRDSSPALVIQTDLNSEDNEPSPEATNRDTRQSIHNKKSFFPDSDREDLWDEGRRVVIPKVVVDKEKGEVPPDIFSDQDALRQITHGVIKLRSHFHNHRNEINYVEGTGCLVKEGQKHYIYTVKHNFFWKPEHGEGRFAVEDTCLLFPRNKKPYNFIDMRLQLFSKGHPSTLQDITPPFNITKNEKEYVKGETVTWSYGFDVVRFEVKMNRDRESIFEHILQAQPFQLPDRPFKYEKGMKVGIVVWDIEYSDDQGRSRLDCYGEQQDINVYRGEILHATDYTIECSYNAYYGCSGAPILSLDMERYPQHFGKVIAVHAGNPTAYKKKKVNDNVAFRLQGRGLKDTIKKEILTAPKKRELFMWGQFLSLRLAFSE